MAEIAGLVLGVIPLCITAYSALSSFVDAFKDAPTEIKTVANQVMAFKSILCQIKDFTATERALLDDVTADHLRNMISHGHDIVCELNEVVEKVSGKHRGKSRRTASFRWAASEQDRVEKLQKCLGHCTGNLNLSLHLLTLRKADKNAACVDETLNTITVQQMRMMSELQILNQNTIENGTLIVRNTEAQYTSIHANPRSTQVSSISRGFAETTLFVPANGRDCSSIRCTCCCHTTVMSFSTPKALCGLLGSVGFQFTGQSRKTVPCNKKTCMRTSTAENSAGSIKVNLPVWFVGLVAMVQANTAMRLASGTLVRIHLTTSREIKWNEVPGLESIDGIQSEDDMSRYCYTLRTLLTSGSLTVSDRIDVFQCGHSNSLLKISVLTANIDFVRFLLASGSSPASSISPASDICSAASCSCEEQFTPIDTSICLLRGSRHLGYLHKWTQKQQSVLRELASAEEFDLFSTDLPLHYLLALPLGYRPMPLKEFLKLQPTEISSFDPDHKLFKGLYPLHVAAQNEETDDFHRLLDYGANINSQSIKGKTALHYACRNLSDPRFIEAIIKAGIDMNHKSHSGDTALESLVDALYKLGWEPNHVLNAQRIKDIVICLVKNGAHVTSSIRGRLEDRFGKSFISLLSGISNRVFKADSDASDSDPNCLASTVTPTNPVKLQIHDSH